MAIAQPVSTDTLVNPDHSLLHRIIAADTSAAVQSLIVNSSGYVGIGTTSPTTKLTLAQAADNNGLRIYGYDDKAAEYGELYLDSSGYFNIVTGGTRSINLTAPTGAAIFFNNPNEVARLQSGQFKLPDDGSFGLGNSAGTSDYAFGYNSADDTFRIAKGGNLTGTPLVTINSTGKVGIGTTTPATLLELAQTTTIAGATNDGYSACITSDPEYTAASAQTVTRHNYFDLNDAGLTNVTLTDAAVFRFDANAGTHKAVDAASTKITVTAVDAWIKVNINGTIYYIPCYTSKTA